MENLFVQNPAEDQPPARRFRWSERWWFRWTFGRSPRWTLARVVVLIATAFLLFRFVLAPIRVVGISMDPNYKNDSVHLISKLAYLRHEPERGDVVAIQYRGPHLLLLKRIIALPGERIRIRRGTVFIDGAPLPEPYLRIKPARWNYPEIKLKPDEFFIIGDNREMKQEDHTFGVWTRRKIVGKLVF